MSPLATFAHMVLCILVLLVTGGCARLPVVGELPQGVQISRLGEIEGATVFDWHPDGARIAIAAEILGIHDTATKELKVLAMEKPEALAWKADGVRLAAAFSREQQTMLRLYDQHGVMIAGTAVDGYVTTLAWLGSGEVLAGALTLERLSFGTIVKQILYQWNGTGKPAATVISETTVRPFIGRWPRQVLYGTFTFSVSPLGEEIVYSRLQDPPQFSPYLKIIIRQMKDGAEMEAATAAVGSGTPIYSADGESIIYGDRGSIHNFDPWQQKDLTTLQSPGRSIALSPGGKFALIDGHLNREGKELVVFPPLSNGRFSPDGKSLVLGLEGHLYLVSGLKDGPVAGQGENIKRQLRSLHRWRSEGLINATDYTAARKRILNNDKTH